jgi:hypothetical protein
MFVEITIAVCIAVASTIIVYFKPKCNINYKDDKRQLDIELNDSDSEEKKPSP